MSSEFEKYEGYVASQGERRWNQSWYYQAYDPVTRTGAFIRLGILENEKEINTWLVVFQNGRPLFTRTNLNLPYTSARPMGGIEIAGMNIHAEVPLKKTRILFDSADFSLDLVWDESAPMEDCIAMSRDRSDAMAREMAQVHLEGTSRVAGTLRHRGNLTSFDGKGFRDVAAGVRNWDGLRHYRLAWPVFENGVALAGVHGFSTSGHDTWLRMVFDGKQWVRVRSIDDQMTFDDEGFAVTQARWVFVDEQDRRWSFTAKPLFNWLFPLDTFVLREQLMEFRLADGTVGYGLYETGYRLPWTPKE